MADVNDISYRIQFIKIRRDGFKSRITKLLKWLDESQMSDIDPSELRRQRDRLKELFQCFDNDQSEREQYENVETVEAEGNSIIQEYCVAIARANSVLDRLQQPTDNVVVLPGPSTSAMNNVIYRLETPFNGNHREWPKFKEDFQRLLRQNSDLSESSKLQMLRSNLSGKMKFAIDSVVSNENNFKAAWNMLREAYDNTYKFTMDYASQLLNTPAMPDDSTESIQYLINHIESHMRWLEISAKSRPDIARILLLSLALTKMGPRTRSICEQTLKNQESRDINDILRYLERHIRVQTLAKSSKSSNHKKPDTEPQKSTGDHTTSEMKRSMESSRATRESKSTSPSTKRRRILPDTCKICNSKSHYPYSCRYLTTLSPHDRKEAVLKAKLCEVCLRPNHLTNECHTKIRCRFCGKRHNTLLHEDSREQLTYYNNRM